MFNKLNACTEWFTCLELKRTLEVIINRYSKLFWSSEKWVPHGRWGPELKLYSKNFSRLYNKGHEKVIMKNRKL